EDLAFSTSTVAQEHHDEEERDRPRKQYEHARILRAPEQDAEDDDHQEAHSERELHVLFRLNRHDREHGRSIERDEDEQRREDPEVLAEHVLVTAKAPREDREDRLQLELA